MCQQGFKMCVTTFMAQVVLLMPREHVNVIHWHLSDCHIPRVWKVILPSYSSSVHDTLEHEGQYLLLLCVCSFYFSGNQTCDTTDRMMSCRIELTFAASVAAFMCFVLYLFCSAIE